MRFRKVKPIRTALLVASFSVGAFLAAPGLTGYVAIAQYANLAYPVGRWDGNFHPGSGSNCGSDFEDVTLMLNIGEKTIDGQIRNFGKSWRFSRNVDSNRSFSIKAPMSLHLAEQDLYISAEIELIVQPDGYMRYSNGDRLLGDFQIDTSDSEYSCLGYFQLDRPDPPQIASSGPPGQDIGNAETPVKPVSDSEFEASFWESIKDGDTPEEFEAYLEQYPEGQFSDLARSRLDAIRSARLQARPPAPRAKPSSDPYANLHFGAYHALVIGIDRYRHMTPLNTATTDARGVARLLREAYGFETRLLVNATRTEIIDSLASYRARLKFDDNFLVYYAGRGVLDDVTQRGYWLPADARKDSPSNWISTGDVTAMVQAIRAKHVMVVADSVYSGTLLRGVQAPLKTADERLAWIERLLSKRSRTALVSGGRAPVPGSDGGAHSVFAKTFLDALRLGDGIIEGQRLFDAIKQPVVRDTDQAPQYSDIRRAGHDGGDFLFVRQR